MRKFIIAAAAALALSGCAAWNTLTSASLTTTQVYVTANAFDAAEVTATNYDLACAAKITTICRDPAAVKPLDAAIRGGYSARKNLIAACLASITAPACVSAYTTVSTAVTGLQAIFSQYSIAKGS